MVQNKSLVFKHTPTGWPKPGVDLAVEDRPLDLDTAEPPAGGIITRNLYTSLDPYQRFRMRDPGTESYFPGFTLGQPMDNSSVCEVLKSAADGFKPGDVVVGFCPMQEYSVLSAQQAAAFRPVDNPAGLPLAVFLGALGMPGLTAYSSLHEIGQPKKGETIFVSAASGAVGQLVGQLAKREGLTVIGSVGDDAKLDFIINELGFDAGFNYKKEAPAAALERLAPQGIDIYYENVGGETLDAALNAMNNRGRIITCGMISQYNLHPHETYGVKNLPMVVFKRLTMRGFIVGDEDMGPRYAAEHRKNVYAWLADGSLKTKTHVDRGMDAAVDAFLGVLSGKNFGKAVLQIAHLEKD